MAAGSAIAPKLPIVQVEDQSRNKTSQSTSKPNKMSIGFKCFVGTQPMWGNNMLWGVLECSCFNAANQEIQTLMLLLGRIDVAVMDESIFRFYREKLIAEGKAPRATEYEVFSLFPPTPYKTAFIDAKVRDEFNRALSAMRRDGRYGAIYRKYIDEYFVVKP
jgi:hypothetical protein